MFFHFEIEICKNGGELYEKYNHNLFKFFLQNLYRKLRIFNFYFLNIFGHKMAGKNTIINFFNKERFLSF